MKGLVSQDFDWQSNLKRWGRERPRGLKSILNDDLNDSTSKNEYSVIVYSSSCQSKPAGLIFSVELNRWYAGNQTILAPIEKKYYGSQWKPKLFGYRHSKVINNFIFEWTISLIPAVLSYNHLCNDNIFIVIVYRTLIDRQRGSILEFQSAFWACNRTGDVQKSTITKSQWLPPVTY